MQSCLIFKTLGEERKWDTNDWHQANEKSTNSNNLQDTIEVFARLRKFLLQSEDTLKCFLAALSKIVSTVCRKYDKGQVIIFFRLIETSRIVLGL